MGLTQVSTSGIKDATVATADIADQAVTLAKLPHGTSSNDGKFLRANNGADPTFETITGTTINNNADNRVITGSGTANTLNGESGLTFDGTELKIGGDSNVSGTWGLEVYNTTGTVGTAVFAGTGGAEIKLQDTVSGETVKIAANGQASFYSQKAGDNMVFYTKPSGGTDQARLLIDSSGNVLIGTTASAAGDLVVKDKTNAGNNIWMIGRASDGTSSLSFRNNADNAYLGRIQTDTNDGMQFQVGGSERMRIDSSGKVGIGTTSPSSALHVTGGAGHGALISSAGTTNGGVLDLQNEQGSNYKFRLAVGGGDNAYVSGRGFFIRDENASATRLVIKDNGNVGIGTTSPDHPLHVNGKVKVSGASTGRIIDTENTFSSGGELVSFQNNSNGAYGGLVVSGGEIDRECRLEAAWGSGFFTFYTDTAEQARLTAGGRLLVNTTTNYNGMITGYALSGQPYPIAAVGGNTSQGLIGLYYSTTLIGSITITGGGSSVSYNNHSDYRLKENATTIADGITRLKTLIPRRFNWKIDESNTLVDGFFAHEVTAVPEAITGTKDEVATEDNDETGVKKGDPVYQMIDQSKLVPLLTAALKEAIAKIEVLETKVAALEAA